MPQDLGYSIHANSSEQTRAYLYGLYRSRIDEETGRRQPQRIIDVSAKKVDLEDAPPLREPRPGAGGESTSAPSDTGTQGANVDRSASRRVAPSRAAAADQNPFMYEPSPASVSLRYAPLQRGVFVDLIV